MAGFVHEALFYRDAGEYLDHLVPFVEEGLESKEPVLVAVPRANGDALRERLGDRAGDVRILDMSSAGRNPGKIIPWVLHAFVIEHAPRRVRIIGEPIWPGRSATAYPACVQHEALINLAFADQEVTILCPYDAQRLEPAAVADAVQTHPVLVQSGRRRDSHGYADPAALADSFNQPLPEPAGPVRELTFTDLAGLGALRAFVASAAEEAGLAGPRTGDLQLAVNEVAVNSLTHGGGPGLVRAWVEPEHLVCEIDGSGQIDQPLAGRVPPGPDSARGRGLVLVNYLCDLVRVHTRAGRTTTRLYLAR